MIQAGTIPEELAPDKWSRFAENIHGVLGPHRNKMPVSTVLEICQQKASSFGSGTFPLLVSLHQFVIGSLLEAGQLQLPGEHTPLLTEELRQVFPGLAISADIGFNLEG